MIRRLFVPMAVLGGLLSWGATKSSADFNLLVVDEVNNAILQVTPTGTVSTFASTNLDSPIGIGIYTSTGNVYVTNNGIGQGTINTVSEFSSTGTFIRSFGASQLNAPQGLAIDQSTGNVFIANADGNIQEYSSNGTFIKTFATGLNDPYGLLTTNGSLYVADYGSNSLLKYDLSTGVLSGSTTAALDGPSGLTIGSDGDLFVSNYSKASKNPLDTVTEYNPTTLGLVGTFATSDTSGLSGPIGLATGSTSHDLYVANFFAGTIERFDANGNDLGTLATIDGGAGGPAFMVFQTPVPEPASMALMGLGIGGMLAYTRYRRLARAEVGA
jgi:streptogramin lyase